MIGYEKKRSLKRIGPIIDKINIVLSVGIILAGIILVVDMKKYIVAFPVLFFLAAIMNLLLGIKCYKMAEMGRMVILLIAFVALLILSIIALKVTVL